MLLDSLITKLRFHPELFKLGDYYGEDDLKRRCEKQLQLLTVAENFDKVYSLAVQHNAEVYHELLPHRLSQGAHRCAANPLILCCFIPGFA